MAAEHHVLNEVPPQLKKLVRLVVRAFYQPEHYILMDILARYPCVNETDLTSLLKVDFKKLRVILSSLKKDKLVKSIQKMESKELENGETKNYLSHYHYINYKVFVNVVKFKLNKMRERIQAEERRVCNKSSYICTNCEKTYTDLDIDRLIDPLEGTLKCIMCGTVLIEETPEVETIDARSVLSKLNDQLKPILDLLKEVENISLAPDVLDPEPKSIEGLINNSKHERSKQQQSKAGWSMNKGYDIYGDQTISINIGDDDKLKKKTIQKEAPQWMKESTIYESDDTMIKNEETGPSTTKQSPALPDDEIMALLVHEQPKKPPNNDTSSSSDTSDDEDDYTNRDTSSSAPKLTWQDESSMTSFGGGSVDTFDSDDSDDSEDELTLNVGGKLYQLSDIGPDVVDQMTPEEKDKYTQLCQKAYSDFY